MHRLTVTQLARNILSIADVLRGRVDTSAYLDIISGMLIIKWASDQRGVLHVPDCSRWPYVTDHADKDPGCALNEALRALLQSNFDVLNGVLENLDFDKRLGRSELRTLIHHFDRLPLGDGDLEFDDVVGSAYDHILGEFAHRDGKRGGESYTPRSVVQLMVRLVRPEEGQSIYDPFAGSGGMLIQAKEYVDEHTGRHARLALFGQEMNSSVWSTARLNLLLHGVTDTSVLCGDTLANPLHMVIDGRRMHFDRVLTNPPFSANYDEREVTFPERMTYGWTPGRSKKADLMNVQHVLALLSPRGIGAVVTPHGVLFRGGAEAEIRRGIVGDGRLEAVIGIGPNVFYGTAIPACILVLRGMNGLPEGRRGKILFVNAEHELVTGRTRNHLEPQNVEKIVEVFHNWTDIPGFSRVVSLDDIAANDFNLNIRRYVESSPPKQPLLDPRAALFGGVPKSDVQREGQRFHAFGIDPMKLFQIKKDDYFAFLTEGYEATAAYIPVLAAPNEIKFIDHYRRWWERTALQIVELVGEKRLLMSRGPLMASFREELLRPGTLDRYQLIGIFAAWWSARHDDLKILDYQGFPAVIDRWDMTHDNPRDQVLTDFGDDLRSRLENLVAVERQALVETYRSWADRYAISLQDLEEQRDTAATRLKSRLNELGYS